MDANLYNHYCSVGIRFSKMFFQGEPMDTDDSKEVDFVVKPTRSNTDDKPKDMDLDFAEKPVRFDYMKGYWPTDTSNVQWSINMNLQNSTDTSNVQWSMNKNLQNSTNYNL